MLRALKGRILESCLALLLQHTQAGCQEFLAICIANHRRTEAEHRPAEGRLPPGC